MKRYFILLVVMFSLCLSDCFAVGKVTPNNGDYVSDRIAIQDVIQQWAFNRDQGLWEELADTFHPDGTIDISWYRGSFDGFVKASIEIAKGDALVKHRFGVPVVKIVGKKAISESDFTILVRIKKGPLYMDVTSYARYIDKLEKREGNWRITERKAIYEKDRIDSVHPSFIFWAITLFTDFDKYPAPYRYLSFLYDKAGLKLADRILVNGSDETKALYKSVNQWLADGQ